MTNERTHFTKNVVRPATAHVTVYGKADHGREVLTEWVAASGIDQLDQVWVDGDDQIGIEAVRDLQRELVLQPIRGEVRLGLIPEAHRLTSQASHALLKLLEDPPAHAMIVLGVEHEDQLLGTILSRCQRWQLRTTRSREINSSVLEIQNLRKLPYYERLKLAETWAKEDNWRIRITNLVAGARQLFLVGKLSPDIVGKLVNYEQLANTNVTPRLLLESCLLAVGRGGQ